MFVLVRVDVCVGLKAGVGWWKGSRGKSKKQA
jgi:hypothetical protein